MKPIILILISILSFGSLSAQTIDWQKFDESIKDIELINPVNYGEFHTFRIENINKFLYKVTIEGANVELETPIPTELQTLFRLSKEDLEETTDRNNVIEAIGSINTEKTHLNNYIIDQKAAKAVAASVTDQWENFYKKLDPFLKNINIVSNEIYLLKVIRVELVNLAMLDVSFNEMDGKIGDPKLKPKDPTSAQKNMKYTFNILKAEYDKILGNSGSPVPNNIEDAYNAAKVAYETIEKESLLLLYSDVTFLYHELQNENNFKVTSPPVQAQEDFVNYEISITPARTNSLGAHKNPITTIFDVPVKGGFKVDFSVGPVFSFGNSAKDDLFYLGESETEGNSILKQRDNNNFATPGIGALMHFYKRSGKNVSWGGLFGVGAGFQSKNDVDLSFYTGLSLVMGKSQKVMISSGISLLSVDRLKGSKYELNNEYKTEDIDMGDVTEKVYKPSFFLSLSYNLTNRSQR